MTAVVQSRQLDRMLPLSALVKRSWHVRKQQIEAVKVERMDCWLDIAHSTGVGAFDGKAERQQTDALVVGMAEGRIAALVAAVSTVIL